MNKSFILLLLSFLTSLTILSFGITFCTKVNYCIRPFENNQCLSVTTDCPYNNFNGMTRGNCCLNGTNTECSCCQFYNGTINLSFCAFGTGLGIILFLVSLYFSVKSGFWKSFRTSKYVSQV